MTGTRIHDALTEVSQAVDPPAPDLVAFEQLVRAERVRQRARLGVGIGAVAAAVVVGGLALSGLPGGDGGGDGGDRKGTVATTTEPAPDLLDDVMYAPAVLNDKLVWVGDNVLLTTGQPAARVVGSTTSNTGALVEDSQGRVWWVREARIQGEPARYERADGEPVRAAVVDRTGSWLTYVDAEGTVHVRSSSDDHDVDSGEIGSGELLAGDGNRWLVLRDGQVTVEGPGEPVALDAGEDARGAQIGEDTVAVQTRGGASFFDLESGERLQLELGGAVGELSTDGAWYATSASDAQRADGMSPDLNLVDTHTGETHVVHGYDDAQQPLSMWWADEDRFAVLSSSGNHRTYWECSVAANSCTEAYDDPTGTLTLPVQ